jgi:hypothetical protein
MCQSISYLGRREFLRWEEELTPSGTMEDTPCINIRGKWLRNIGIDLGSKMRLLESDNMIVLLKLPEEEVERNKLEAEVESLERRLEALRRQLA